MVGVLSGCGQQSQSGSTANAQTGAGGAGCPPGQAEAGAGKGADGLPACMDIQGPPAVTAEGSNAGNGSQGGTAAQGSAGQTGGTKPGGTGTDGTNAGGTKPGGASSGGTKPDGTSSGGTKTDGTSSGGTKPGGTSSGGTKPDGTSSGGTKSDGNSSGGTKPDGTSSGGTKPDGTSSGGTKPPQDNKPPAPPVKLDKPTEPATAYTGTGAKLVALTFDDGPDNKYTPAILNVLKANKIHATFFTVGLQVKRYGAVMKRIAEEGSEIGNHSYSHQDLSKLDSTHILNQIKWTDALIDRQAGFVPRLVRAPYGASSPLLKQIMADNGRSLVYWTVDTRDWEGSSIAAMRANVNKNTHPGGIILMHSFGSKHVANTVQLLPLIIKDLRAKGYTFVTVGELLDAKAKNKASAKK